MTCIGCAHLLTDGEMALCALQMSPARTMLVRLDPCEKHTQTPEPEPLPKPVPVPVPPEVLAIIARTAEAFGVTPIEIRTPARQGSVNQYVRHRSTPEALHAMTLVTARYAAILLVLDAGFTHAQTEAAFARPGHTARGSIMAAQRAAPIIRADPRIAAYFSRPLSGKEGCS